MSVASSVTAPLAKSSGHGRGGNRSPSPQGAKGKEAMEIDGNDLWHLSYGLELDDFDDDLFHSTIVRDDHDLFSEDDRMQEDSQYSPEIELVPATPDKKARKRSNTKQHRNSTAARKLAVATTSVLSLPEPAP